MFVLFLIIIISLLLVGGPICYAWKKGVNDTTLFLIGLGAIFILSFLFLISGNVFQRLEL